MVYYGLQMTMPKKHSRQERAEAAGDRARSAPAAPKKPPDSSPGVATLDMLAKRGRGVRVGLVTHSNGELAESDFAVFGAQCGKFTKTIFGICRDRFTLADKREIFWTGASLKDAGRLTFAAAKMGAEAVPGLLESIRKATSERREYGRGKRAVFAVGVKAREKTST